MNEVDTPGVEWEDVFMRAGSVRGQDDEDAEPVNRNALRRICVEVVDALQKAGQSAEALAQRVTLRPR